MRTDPGMLLRGVVKFVAVVLAAGLAGAGIGIALAELSGNDEADVPLLPSTTERTSTSAGRPATTTPSTTATTATTAVYRIPRVQILTAEMGPPAESTGRTRVTVRVRVTNRGLRALTITSPTLLSRDDEVPLAADARDAAGPLLRPIAVGSSATGELRFAVPSEVAARFADTPAARLRMANRTVIVKLSTSEGTG